MALTGPRSVAINSLHPCSHWPLFAIAPTHEWIGNGANQTCTWAIVKEKKEEEEEDAEEGPIGIQNFYFPFTNRKFFEEDSNIFKKYLNQPYTSNAKLRVNNKLSICRNIHSYTYRKGKVTERQKKISFTDTIKKMIEQINGHSSSLLSI